MVQEITGDDSTGATTLHKLRINETYHILLSRYNKRSLTEIDTVADQQSYELPYNYEKITSVKVTISSIDYMPKEVLNEDYWNQLNSQGTSFTSDTPECFYIFDNNILIYPTPSTDGNTITIYHSIKDKDLSEDNHTTESIKTLANGGTAVVGNTGTVWTSAMIGRHIKINDNGYWYKITAVADATHLTIEKKYQGTAIAAGTASYTISEIPQIPIEYHSALYLRAVYLYLFEKRDQISLAQNYKSEYEEIIKSMTAEDESSSSQIIDSSEPVIRNPNDWPQV